MKPTKRNTAFPAGVVAGGLFFSEMLLIAFFLGILLGIIGTLYFLFYRNKTELRRRPLLGYCNGCGLEIYSPGEICCD